MTDSAALSIRPAEPADWPAIWAIMHAVITKGDSYSLDATTSETEARAYWTGERCQAFVAERGGEIVGTYALRANQPGRGAHVANAGFMVRADRSGGGVGAAMGEHALQTARLAGYRAMQFNYVVSTNTRAVALWTRLGFTIVGTVPGAFSHAERGLVDVYIMFRELT